MAWNTRQILRRSFRTTFRKGMRSWWSLLVVCLLFSYIGATETSQTAIVEVVDDLIGAENNSTTENLETLKTYVIHSSLVEKYHILDSEHAEVIFDALSKNSTWLVQLLSLNAAYLKRNTGEVIAFMLLATVMSIIYRFFILDTFLVGHKRYVMENRFEKHVKYRRMLAPFHKDTIWNLAWVSFVHAAVLALWSLTIVGGIYKWYQYGMVRFLLAENPKLKWREVKRLSSEMTNGYKWKMFKVELSLFYIWLLRLLPFVGAFVAMPMQAQLDAEFYFTLRQIHGADPKYFPERAFDALPYVETAGTTRQEKAPQYLLEDYLDEVKISLKGAYRLTDYITMFFLFSFIGWLWEVGLHIVQEHEIVNRGTLYGPWLPIYGVGGVVIIFLLDRFKKKPSHVFALAILLCAGIEYLTSFILDIFYNVSYWDYHGMFMNVNGRICIAGLLAFGLGGLFGIYLAAPKVHEYMNKLSRRTQITICAILCALFLSDVAFALINGFNSGVGVGEKL